MRVMHDSLPHDPSTGATDTMPSIAAERDVQRRTERLRALNRAHDAREFVGRRRGMIHAMDGGLWLHRHVWQGRPMVHLVSIDRERLLRYGRDLGVPADRLQFKPLKDPRTTLRVDAWHWDLGGPVYPPLDPQLLHTEGD